MLVVPGRPPPAPCRRFKSPPRLSRLAPWLSPSQEGTDGLPLLLASARSDAASGSLAAGVAVAEHDTEEDNAHDNAVDAAGILVDNWLSTQDPADEEEAGSSHGSVGQFSIALQSATDTAGLLDLAEEHTKPVGSKEVGVLLDISMGERDRSGLT